jgi:hypothetical protein
MKSKKLRLAALAMSFAMVATSVPSSVLAADFTSDYNEEATFDIVEPVDVIDDFTGGEVSAVAPVEEDLFSDEEIVAEVAEDPYLGEVGATVNMANVRVIDENDGTIEYVDEVWNSESKSKTPVTKTIAATEILDNTKATAIKKNKDYGRLALAYSMVSTFKNSKGEDVEVNTWNFVALSPDNIIENTGADAEESCTHGDLYNVQYTFTGAGTWNYWESTGGAKFLERAGTEGGFGHTYDLTAQPLQHDVVQGDCETGATATYYNDFKCTVCDTWWSESNDYKETDADTYQIGPKYTHNVAPTHNLDTTKATITRYSATEIADSAVGKVVDIDANGVATIKDGAVLTDKKPDKYPYWTVTIGTCTNKQHKYVLSVEKSQTAATGLFIEIINNIKTSESEFSIVDETAQDPVVKPANEDIQLVDCSKPGSYRVCRTDEKSGTKLIVKTVTVDPHHVPDYMTVTCTKEKNKDEIVVPLGTEDWTCTDKTNLVNVYRKDGVLHVVSKNCLPVTYKLSTYCKNEHKKNGTLVPISTEEGTSEVVGHLYDDELKTKIHALENDKANATYKNLKDLVNKQYKTDDDRVKPDENSVFVKIIEGYKDGKQLWEGAATCEQPGTVLIQYLCAADITHPVEEEYFALTAPLYHLWDTDEEGNTVENVKATVPATCLKEGSLTTATICDRCHKEETKTYILPALGHSFGTIPDSTSQGKIDESNVKVEKRGNLIVDDGDSDKVENKGSLEKLLEGVAVGKTVAINSNVVPESAAIRQIEFSLKDTCKREGCDEKVDYAWSTTKAKVELVSIKKAGNYCNEKEATFKVTFTGEDANGKEVKNVEPYVVPYYSSGYDYNSRTNHEPGTPVTENMKPSTATEAGSCDSVVYCEKCHQEISRTTIPIPVGGEPHELKHVEAVAPTCEKEGNIEYWVCEEESRYYLDADAATPVDPAQVILPAAHDLEFVEAKDPTYDEEGNIAYWVCKVCGELYKEETDAEGNVSLVKTTEEEVKLAKLEKLPDKVTGVKVYMYPSDVYPTRGYATISWKASDGADNYRVSVRPLGTTEWTKIETNSAATTYTVREPLITVGMTYEIRVAAGKNGVFGPRSDVIRRYYESITVKYTATKDTITADWNAVEKGTSYKVMYSENKSMKPYKTVIVRGGTTSAVLKELKPDTRYYVRVYPYDKTTGKTARGAASQLKSVKTKKK